MKTVQKVRGNRKENTNQLVRIILELLLQHDPEPGRPVLLLHRLQVVQELVRLIASLDMQSINA